MLENLQLPRLREAGDPPLVCETENPELWFATHPREQARAMILCRSCHVRQACEDQIMELERREGALRHGVVAGLSPQARYKMSRKRGHTTQKKGKYA